MVLLKKANNKKKKKNSRLVFAWVLQCLICLLLGKYSRLSNQDKGYWEQTVYSPERSVRLWRPHDLLLSQHRGNFVWSSSGRGVKLTTRTFRAEDLYIYFLIFLHGLHRNNFIFILLCIYLFFTLFIVASGGSHILGAECQGGSE